MTVIPGTLAGKPGSTTVSYCYIL